MALLAMALAVVAVAGCAEKATMPPASPRFTLRVSMLARPTAAAQKIVVFAIYFSGLQVADNGDSVRIIDTVSAPVTGVSQDVTLKIDLTACLADPTRGGSRDACSMYVGAFLVPSTFTFDAGDPIGRSTDFQILGPFDAAPGKPPVVPSIDLSQSRFTVARWEGDEALRLGGDQTPQFLSGPIAGASNGSAAPTLFAVTGGGQISTAGNGNVTVQPVTQLAIFQNGTWKRVNGPSNTSFNDVAAFSPTDVYLAGGDGLYHYDGTSISSVSSVREPLRSVAVATTSGGRFLVAGTNAGNVWFSNLTTFTRGSTGGTQAIDGVCVNSATEAFALNRGSGTLYRFDGTNWIPAPASFTQSKTDLQCLGPGLAYVGVQTGPNSLLRWNGAGWTQIPGPPANGRGLNWAVVSANQVYAVGDSSAVNRVFYRYDGTTWREVGRSAMATGLQSRPWADPRGGAFVASSANNALRVDQVNASGVAAVSFRPSFRDVAMPSSSSAFVVGANALLARLVGTSWIVDAPPAGTATSVTLQGVWADGPSNAWTVGSGSAIMRWDGTRWNLVSDARRPVAATDNYNAVWGGGGSVWAVGDATILRCRTATTCANEASPAGGALYGIWGSSATNVWAVGANGRIVRFDGNAWTAVASPTGGRLTRVWGSAPNDVWVQGDTVLLHFDGAAWVNRTQAFVGNVSGYSLNTQLPFQTALWGVSAKEVYAATWFGRIERGTGAFWGDADGQFDWIGPMMGIAGSPGGCAIAITGGFGLSGPMMFRGVGPNGCLSSPTTGPVSLP